MSFKNSSVFYFRKQIDNSFCLECSVTMVPLHKLALCGYTFTLTAVRNFKSETAVLENLTSDRSLAEKLFDRICADRILPSELEEFAERLITER